MGRGALAPKPYSKSAHDRMWLLTWIKFANVSKGFLSFEYLSYQLSLIIIAKNFKNLIRQLNFRDCILWSMENIRYILYTKYMKIYNIVLIVSVGAVTWYGKDCINVKCQKRYGGRKGDKLQLHLWHYQIWYLTKFTFHLSENWYKHSKFFLNRQNCFKILLNFWNFSVQIFF